MTEDRSGVKVPGGPYRELSMRHKRILRRPDYRDQLLVKRDCLDCINRIVFVFDHIEELTGGGDSE